jgi:hypothetical protein
LCKYRLGEQAQNNQQQVQGGCESEHGSPVRIEGVAPPLRKRHFDSEGMVIHVRKSSGPAGLPVVRQATYKPDAI